MAAGDPPGDLELLERYRRGDARGMDALVERHGGAVYAFVRRFLGASPQADDVTQEVWLRVLRGQAGFDGRARFTTWLYAVARSACLDHLRRQQRRPDLGEGAPPEQLAELADPGPALLDRVARRELSEALEGALAELPPDLREVFLLREHTDQTFSEIAQALELPRDTVKSRMRYALLRLRRLLQGRLGQEVKPRGL